MSSLYRFNFTGASFSLKYFLVNYFSRISSLCLPNCRVGEIFMRNVEVNILRSAGSVSPGTSECWEQVDLGVEVETQCCEVSPQSQTHQVRISLRCSDECQQSNHSKLINNHVGGNVRHQP